MKQTNNAIKFLMAQYRAIFKNANIAMVAAMAAAALAAGQAQAAAGDLEKANWATLDGEVLVGSGAPTYSGSLSLTADSNEPVANNNKFTLKIIAGNTHAITGNTGDQGGFTATNGSLDISGSADVDATKLEVGKTSGAEVTFKDISVTKGTLALTKGTINAEAITLGDTSKLTMAEGVLSAGKISLESGSTVEITKGTLGKTGATITVGKDATLDSKINGQTEGKVVGALNVEGTVTAAQGKFLTVEGVADFKSGSTFTSSGTTILPNGGTIDNDATLTVDAGSEIHIGGATLTLSSANLKKILTGNVKSMQDQHAVIALNDETTKEKPLNLSGTSIIGDDTGNVSAKFAKQGSGTITVQGGYAEYRAANDITGQDGVILSFKGLTLGKDNNVTLKSGGVAVSESLTVAGNKTLTLDSGSALTLDGVTGSVDAASLTIGSAASAGTLNVKNGTWTLPALTVTSGAATVEDQATLKVNGALTATTAGQLVVNGGTVDVQGSGSSLVLKGAQENTVKLSAGGVLKIDAEDILSGKTFSNTNFEKSSVSGDGSAVIDIAGGEQLSDTDFKTFYAATGFKGVFKMNVKVDATGELTTDNAVIGLQTDAYNDKTLNVAGASKNNITAAYSVGNVNVKAPEDVKLAAGGSLILNNANAEGIKGNFVTKQSGSGTAVGGVEFGDAGNSLTLVGAGNIAAITAIADKNGKVVIGQGGEAATAGAVTVIAGNSIGGTGKQINGLTLNAGSSLKVASGDVFTVNLDSQAGTVVDVNGNITTNDLNFIGTSLKANTLELTAGAGPLDTENLIAGGAKVELGTLKLADKQLLEIGQNTDIAENSSTATVYAGTLDLNSGSVFVDPTSNIGYSLLAVNNLSGTVTGNQAGTLNGTVTVGNNGVFGVGFDNDQALVDMLAKYTDPATGALGDFKSALVLNKQVTLSNSTDGVTVDPAASGASATAGQIELKSGSGLVLTDNVYTVDGQGNKQGSAITFTNGTVNVDGSKLILVGDFSGADKAFSVFSGATSISGTMTIESANGLLTGTLDTAKGTVGLSFDRANADKVGAFADASAPVRELLFGKLSGDVKGKGLGFDLISDVATSALSGAVADAAAHAATYAGAQQAAVVSVTTMADAMFGRVGSVGVEAASIAATGSQANGGVWLTPMYKSMDADGFNAEGASYGSDVDAAGVAFGADSVNGNMRFGAVFNIGSGDAEGKGNGNGLKDEFDYYGFGIYSAMGFGSFALVGDASMTVVSHDVQGLGLKGKADTTAVTMGVTGQYTVATPMVDVTPHLGARFIRLNTDSYDLVGADGVVATTDFDVQNVFSVPLGVTLSKGFTTTGGWTLAPSADLSITFNSGDTEAKSSTTFTGVKAINLNTEVLDEVQYGLTVGLGAQYGAFGTSFGLNYTGSSNTDSFGVNAQARYMF
ncbi:beta strand repeat-containing protein [Anaerobiospirillum succiniciproducens]|uniref:beta strand repeat-containing protein n=1 Tax=Anaerobiospirillum succiniciproducens TaxID=13335 RepID=UPI003F8A426B